MELETLFTDQKWKILSALSNQGYSPLQLAEKSGVSMANISQHLKLLEFSNIVKKDKISNRDKGKPRSLFQLSNDCAYIISLMGGFADKKLIKLDALHKILLKIFYVEDANLRYFLGKFIWEIESYLDDIDLIVLKSGKDAVDVLIGSDDVKKIDSKLKDITIKNANKQSMLFRITVRLNVDVEKLAHQKREIFLDPNALITIHDEKRVVSEILNNSGTYFLS